MKTKTRFVFLKVMLIALFFTCCRASFALDNSTPIVTPDASSQNKKNNDTEPTTTLIVHKPSANPAWGKVISYQQEQAISSTDKTHEILHKFLFQDSQGIVRLATFHESASGGGYWEVWVWDQP
jgi:hypothetical protein